MRGRDYAYGGKDFENKCVSRSLRNWSRESANVLQASLEEAGWRMNGGRVPQSRSRVEEGAFCDCSPDCCGALKTDKHE